MAKSTSERVASALANKAVRLTDLESLIPEATAERDREVDLATEAEKEALDFALPEHLRDEAAARADRHKRNAKALASALTQLAEILETKRESEARKASDAAIAKVLEARASLVRRIREEWPDIAARAANLFAAIQANDAEMKKVGVYDPSAEAEARGCDPLFRGVLRLTSIKIPAPEGSGLLWPPPPAPRAIFDVGEAFDRERKARENRAADQKRAAEEHARLHGRYRLSTNHMNQYGAVPVRLPADIVRRTRNLPGGIIIAEDWIGELAHADAVELRNVAHLKVECLDKPAERPAEPTNIPSAPPLSYQVNY